MEKKDMNIRYAWLMILGIMSFPLLRDVPLKVQ